MENTGIRRITELQDGETFTHYETRVLRRRLDTLVAMMDENAPLVMMPTSAALVIKSMVCAFGPAVLAEFAKLCIVHQAQMEMGFCIYHDDDSADHRITDASRGMCDECWTVGIESQP